MAPRMIVYAAPARRNRDSNPYNYLLSEALSVEGCEVHELNRENGIFVHADVIHLHWPQNQSRGRFRIALKKSVESVIRLVIQRTRGAAIVWTVHNIHAHDQNNPVLERVLMWCITRIVSGVVYLSASSRSAAEATYPALLRKPYAIIPHGTYGDFFRSCNDRSITRDHLGLPATEKVISFVGDIAPYKGLDNLLEAAMDLKPKEAVLLVAGAFKADDGYIRKIRAMISRLRTSGHSVVFIERRLSNSEMVDALNASDVLALPYRRVNNSGLAILAAEHGTRLLTTDHDVFRDLRDELGEGHVIVAGQDLNVNVLRTALSQDGGSVGQSMDTFLRVRSWPSIAAQTVAFYRRCGASSRQSRVTQWHGV